MRLGGKLLEQRARRFSRNLVLVLFAGQWAFTNVPKKMTARFESPIGLILHCFGGFGLGDYSVNFAISEPVQIRADRITASRNELARFAGLQLIGNRLLQSVHDVDHIALGVVIALCR